MTTTAAALLLGCSRVTVQHWARRLGWVRDGRDYSITERRMRELRRLVRERPGRPPKPPIDKAAK